MLFSVIIPVYNAEKTLRRCVDSLLTQDCQEAELLLVNDGSSDASGAICAEYARKDFRVRLIDKPNGGVSSARNAGLDAATGKYVLFVDSDDYAAPDYFQQIQAALGEHSWDLIRFAIAPAGTSQDLQSQPSRTAFPTREALFPRIIHEICTKDINSPCAKVFRREIIDREGLRFPLGASVAEDRALNIRYSMYMTSYLISNRVIYYVNTENEQSLSRKHHMDLSSQFEITGSYVRQAIASAKLPESEKEQYRRAYQFGICRGIYKDAKDLRKQGLGWFARQKALWKKCREINAKHMRYPATTYCRRIYLPVLFQQTWLIDLIAKRLLHASENK